LFGLYQKLRALLNKIISLKNVHIKSSASPTSNISIIFKTSSKLEH